MVAARSPGGVVARDSWVLDGFRLILSLPRGRGQLPPGKVWHPHPGIALAEVSQPGKDRVSWPPGPLQATGPPCPGNTVHHVGLAQVSEAGSSAEPSTRWAPCLESAPERPVGGSGKEQQLEKVPSPTATHRSPTAVEVWGDVISPVGSKRR